MKVKKRERERHSIDPSNDDEVLSQEIVNINDAGDIFPLLDTIYKFRFQ